MEPFGLFQILQSLLNATNAATPEEREPPTEPVNETSEEKTPCKPQPVLETDGGAHSAILDFIAAHDARAKRIKK